MNRIKELIEQVGTDSSGKWMRIDQAELLAELIIRECASFADKHNQQKLYEDYTLGVGKAIKKHFGVEE